MRTYAFTTAFLLNAQSMAYKRLAWLTIKLEHSGHQKHSADYFIVNQTKKLKYIIIPKFEWIFSKHTALWLGFFENTIRVKHPLGKLNILHLTEIIRY